MAGGPWSDDDALLAALREARQRAEDVPPEFVAAARAVFTWRTVDAELAALVHDSALEAGQAVRGDDVPGEEPAALRTLTFTTSQLTLEVEVTDGALLGQVVPTGPGELELRELRGPVSVARIDEDGCFVVRPVPTGTFRLHVRAVGGTSALTGWTRL